MEVDSSRSEQLSSVVGPKPNSDEGESDMGEKESRLWRGERGGHGLVVGRAKKTKKNKNKQTDRNRARVTDCAKAI